MLLYGSEIFLIESGVSPAQEVPIDRGGFLGIFRVRLVKSRLVLSNSVAFCKV